MIMTSPSFGYTSDVSAKKVLIWFSSLKQSCDVSRSSVRSPCGFVVCASNLWRLGRGARKGSPVSARIARSATRSSRRHLLAEGAAVVANRNPWSPYMAHTAPAGDTSPATHRPTDYRFSGFSYQNWQMDGEPPITVNPKASLHHKLAWLWGEVSMLNDAVSEMNCSDSRELRTFSSFVLSRLLPMEAMLDHLGDITAHQGTTQCRADAL